MSMPDFSDDLPSNPERLMRPPLEELAEYISGVFEHAQALQDAELSQLGINPDPDRPRVMWLDHDFGNPLTGFATERILLLPPVGIVTSEDEITSKHVKNASWVHIFRPKVFFNTNPTDSENIDDELEGEIIVVHPTQYVLYFETPDNASDVCYLLHETLDDTLSLEPYDGQTLSVEGTVNSALLQLLDELATFEAMNSGQFDGFGEDQLLQEDESPRVDTDRLAIEMLAQLKKLRPAPFQPN